ncbi:Ger(x)C family spore germination protein [Bacillus sp. 03113]|uniref:Ger(x)C family spore germination protein n=1 Tax=Bacillus sp. 03113 TaxID=2578211 RepID=UPI001144E2C3|nr:Ger(x)C family spore germination protein [Bacillus sp. 03113]
MKRKWTILGMLVVLMIFNTGCWNRRELNDLAIEIAMGVDKVGNQYLVTSQVVDPGEVAARERGGNRAPVITYQMKANTIFEARRKITTISPRKIYASHLRMVVIGEELAKEGINGILDYLSRDHEHRTDFFIVVARGTSAGKVLKILTPLEKIPANKLFSSLETSQRNWAPTTGVTLDMLINDLVNKGKQPILTGLRVKGEQKVGESPKNVEEIGTPSQLQYSGIGVFKNDQLIGWLNEIESKGYNYLIDNVKSTVGFLPCNDGKITFEVIRSKTDLKGKVIKGTPKIYVKLDIEANVGSVECRMKLMDEKTIANLEKKSEQKIKSMLKQTINKAQEEYGVDIFGFGEAIHRADPQYWKKVKGNWDEIFVDVPVNMKIDVKIRRIGTVGESFLEGK